MQQGALLAEAKQEGQRESKNNSMQHDCILADLCKTAKRAEVESEAEPCRQLLTLAQATSRMRTLIGE